MNDDLANEISVLGHLFLGKMVEVRITYDSRWGVGRSATVLVLEYCRGLFDSIFAQLLGIIEMSPS